MRVNLKFKDSSNVNSLEKAKLPERGNAETKLEFQSFEDNTPYMEEAAEKKFCKETGGDCCLESPFFKEGFGGGNNDDYNNDNHNYNNYDNGNHDINNNAECNENRMLARAYVPNQCYGETFGPTMALITGTLFPELYRPYDC